MSIEQRWDAVPAFPTRSEIWLKLLQAREAQRRLRAPAAADAAWPAR